MAKLVKCKTCGETIAKNAKVCPHCGARRKQNIPLGIFLIVVGLIVLFSGLGKTVSTRKAKKNSQPATSAVTATAAVEETTAPDVAGSDEIGGPDSDEPAEVNPATISLEEFNAISTGMTYEEVVTIIGSEGKILSEVDIGMGDEYKTIMYMWEGDGSLGANANVTIQGGKVTAKAQFGLK